VQDKKTMILLAFRFATPKKVLLEMLEDPGSNGFEK
jgi:hypothetical protein